MLDRHEELYTKFVLNRRRELTQLLTAEQVAERLQITPKAVRRLVLAGELRAYRITPRRLRFDPAEVDAWLGGRSVGQWASGRGPHVASVAAVEPPRAAPRP